MAIRFPKNIFHSARLKLTLFYLGILLVFSLTVTVGIRTLAQSDYQSSDIATRGAYRNLFLNNISPYYNTPNPNFDPDSGIEGIQAHQEANAGDRLNWDLFFINIIALVIGGALSYWFAGRALRPIEESHETQKRFAADASHELRTPLTTMKLENEVFLRQKSFTSDEAKELIHSNLEEVQRLESLAGSLLALTQYGTTPIDLKPTQVRPLVDNAVTLKAKPATDKKIEVSTVVDSGLVIGHVESLTQLISIILDNAIKYSPEGKKVYISGYKRNPYYFLNIRDEGPGIDPADLPHIFDRLYRGDKSRTQDKGGYGLGLSLAEEIARVNHSTITASNHPTGGAQFVVRLNLK